MLFLVVGGCAETIAPTKSSIFGVVKDAETAQPLVGCNVMLVPSGRSATTGEDGVYHFEDIFPEQYSVEITKNGYYNNKKSVVVVAGERSTVDVLLTRFDPENRLPTVGSVAASGIAQSSVRLESEVVDQGSSAVSERGFIYSEIPNPTLSNGIKKSVQSGVGLFSSSITDLKEQTKYHVVAYAINSRGTAYSNEQYSFTTLKQGDIPLPSNVVYVSVSGSDAADGSSWAKAKKTIGAAVAVATKGKQVWISAGAYSEALMPKNGVPIYGGFNGTEARIEDRTARTAVSGIECVAYTEETVVDGFSVSNSTGRGPLVTLKDHIVLQNCLISENIGSVVSVVSCQNRGAVMQDCILDGSVFSVAVYAVNVAEDGVLTMINCFVRGNDCGIFSVGNLTMYGCVVANNANGVWIYGGASTTKLVNCTISSNDRFGLAAQSRRVDMYNCLVWNNTLIERYNGQITRNSCIEVSSAENSAVHFTRPSVTKGAGAKDWKTADWSLSTGSNCIDKGTNIYFPSAEMPTDIAGNPRVVGASIDVGAYEY